MGIFNPSPPSDYIDAANYGAVLDADGVTDISATSGSNVFTSATAGWAEGQTLVVRGAGSAGATFVGTIASVSGTSATCGVSETAGTTASSLTGFYGTDDTDAWQAALDAASPGDTVDAGNAWRSLCTGTLTLAQNVKLVRSGTGPHDPQNNPVRNVHGPTFVVVQDNVTPFITMNHGCAVGDPIIYSANQLDPSSSTPTTFKEMIYIPEGKAGCFIDQPYIPNAFRGMRVEGGRHRIVRPCIGALNRAIWVDHSEDWIEIDSLVVQVYWNIVEGRATNLTTGFDNYVLGNLWALEFRRADSFFVGMLKVFRGYGALLLNDSNDVGLATRPGYGLVSSIDADKVAYGVYGVSTNTPGVLVAQLIAAANDTGGGTAGQSAVATVGGGTIAPKIVVKSWSHRGTWAGGATSVGAGSISAPASNPG